MARAANLTFILLLNFVGTQNEGAISRILNFIIIESNFEERFRELQNLSHLRIEVQLKKMYKWKYSLKYVSVIIFIFIKGKGN